MEPEYGEFLFKAVPVLILFGVSVIVAVVAQIFKKRHYDGPDHRED